MPAVGPVGSSVTGSKATAARGSRGCSLQLLLGIVAVAVAAAAAAAGNAAGFLLLLLLLSLLPQVQPK